MPLPSACLQLPATPVLQGIQCTGTQRGGNPRKVLFGTEDGKQQGCVADGAGKVRNFKTFQLLLERSPSGDLTLRQYHAIRRDMKMHNIPPPPDLRYFMYHIIITLSLFILQKALAQLILVAVPKSFRRQRGESWTICVNVWPSHFCPSLSSFSTPTS